MRSKKSIGKYIKMLRSNSGLSQDNLASKLHVDRSYISKWEQGKNLNEEYFKKISEVFHINEEMIKSAGRNKKFILIKEFLQCNSKKLCLFLSSIFGVAFLFLLMYFVDNFNTIKYYNVNVDENRFVVIENGYFFRSKEKTELSLNLIYKIEENEIDYVSIYSNIDGKKNFIFKTQQIEHFYFVDYNNYGEYFDFSLLDETINNLFLEIKFCDESSVYMKLNLYENYSNNKIFKSRNKMSFFYEEDDDFILKSKLNGNIKKALKAMTQSENNESITIKYNGNEYVLYNLGNIIGIKYYKSNFLYLLEYTDINSELFTKSIKKNNNNMELIYSYNMSLNQCEDIDNKIYDCSTYADDLFLFNKILELIS